MCQNHQTITTNEKSVTPNIQITSSGKLNTASKHTNTSSKRQIHKYKLCQKDPPTTPPDFENTMRNSSCSQMLTKSTFDRHIFKTRIILRLSRPEMKPNPTTAYNLSLLQSHKCNSRQAAKAFGLDQGILFFCEHSLLAIFVFREIHFSLAHFPFLKLNH